MPRLAPRNLTIAVFLTAALALCELALCGAAFAQSPAGSVFTVARVPVKAEASDAVKAKQQAVIAGQRQDATVYGASPNFYIRGFQVSAPNGTEEWGFCFDVYEEFYTIYIDTML